MAGGILAVLFRNAGRPKKVQCNRCGALFSFRTPSSDLWLLVFWLWVSPTIVTLIILLVMVLGVLGVIPSDMLSHNLRCLWNRLECQPRGPAQ